MKRRQREERRRCPLPGQLVGACRTAVAHDGNPAVRHGRGARVALHMSGPSWRPQRQIARRATPALPTRRTGTGYARVKSRPAIASMVGADPAATR